MFELLLVYSCAVFVFVLVYVWALPLGVSAARFCVGGRSGVDSFQHRRPSLSSLSFSLVSMCSMDGV